MTRMLVATRNRGKLRELELLLRELDLSLALLEDFPEVPEVVEDGATFAENAVKKAKIAAAAAGIPALADDSGLVVDALGGRPGVHSARFAGPGADDALNNRKLLEELASIPQGGRSAGFRCVIALCSPSGECVTFEGDLAGEILEAPRGEGGFGYDPLFLVPEYSRTLAELPMETKNVISHRARALAKLKTFLGNGGMPAGRGEGEAESVFLR